MTVNKLIVQNRLPSLNELISALNHNHNVGAGLKKKTEKQISANLHATTDVLNPGYWLFIWHECNKRRDPDNIASAHKFVYDALQTLGFIPNDNWVYNRSMHDEFIADMEDLESCYVEIIHCETRAEYITEIIAFVPEL